MGSIICTLLDDIKRKDTLISHLTTGDTTHTSCCHDDINIMKKQLTELQYINTKLRVDAMNRPHGAELKACQLKVNKLETELKKYKCVHESETSIECLKDIATILNIDNIADVVPEILTLQYETEQLNDIKPYLQSLSKLFSSPVHTDLLCPSLWSSIVDTVSNWKESLNQFKELQLIFMELYTAIEGNKKKRKNEVMNYSQMKHVLQLWLASTQHSQDAQLSVVMSMIKHFQELFDVQSLDGVYVAMTTVYRQLRESHTAYRQVTELLDQPGCSWQRLVSLLEQLMNFKEKKLYIKLCEQYGTLSYSQIIDSISLSQQFFPEFHTLVTQLQSLLGVDSMSAILPAVRRLSYQ